MFITFEGPDGGGKTCHLPLLAEYLRQQGLEVLTTYEPGGTAISDQVRDILKSMENKSMHPRTEILLFNAARAQLVEEVIQPALKEGKIVLSDRYADSTLAYQGYGHGVSLDFLRQLLNFATGGLWPHLTLLLDIAAEEGLMRRKINGGEWNRLDDYSVEFHRRVQAGYLELAKAEPQRWRIVPANRPFDEVQEDLRQIVWVFIQQSK